MDEGFQKERWKGNDCGEHKNLTVITQLEHISHTCPKSSNQDSTFEFEKRRNRPIRYNRETMESTLRAMKVVSEIRHKRQDMFFKMRMRAHKGIQREQVRAEIKKGEEILAPAAADREKAIAIASKKIVSRQKAVEGKMEN